jgi:hypothetical protein
VTKAARIVILAAHYEGGHMFTLKHKRLALNLLGGTALALAVGHLLIEYASGMMANPMFFNDGYKIAVGALAFAGAIALLVSNCLKDFER